MEKKKAKFLHATYGCESDSPEILQKLKEIIGNNTEKKTIAEKIFLWVRDNIRYELNPVVGAVKILKRKTGACVDKSSLFIALCRAAGIPARYVLVTAHLLAKKDIDLLEINHCATEIYIDGDWQIFDATFDPSLLSLFPQASFDSANWWDPKKSQISYKTKEIDKNLADLVSQSYEKHEINLKFKKIIAKERS
ncbi:MAG: transglutaminase family protein [Candidatus Hodarchaeota archaeon]